MAPLVPRLRGLLLGVPVFAKVMGIALGLAVALGAGMLWQIRRTWHTHLVGELDRRGQDLAQAVSARCAELLHAGAAADIPAALRQALSQVPDAVSIVLKDQDGAVLGQARTTEIATRPEQTREMTAPVGGGAHHVLVALTSAGVDHEVAWLTRRLARVTAVIGALGMIGAWWLTRLFAHPLEELVALTRAVKAGDYHARAPVRARDEVGELATAFNEMTDAIARKEAARQQLLRQVLRAGEEERKRIARELHDQTGQALTSQIAGLGALENQTQPGPLHQRLAELRQQAERTLAEVHDLSVTLRPSVLDDVGLIPALQRHCQLFAQRLGLEVALDDIGLDGQRLPGEIELTLYRVVQEALTNAVRHGQARRVRAAVQYSPARVLAVIRDNGCGFDANDWQRLCIEGNHLGLLGLEERVTLLGGSFCVESTPGKGTAVYADIPIPSPA